jgi:hypothetical protein
LQSQKKTFDLQYFKIPFGKKTLPRNQELGT